MGRRFAWSVWVAGFVAALTIGICSASDETSQRRFQVRDSIAMARFAEPGLISPDGRYIATSTERGRLEQNVTEGTIWLFDSSVVRQAINQPHRAAVKPTVLVQMSASINGGSGVLGHGAIISRMKWEPGSDSLLFLGCNGGENRQLFRVSLRDHKLTALSLPTQDVVDYAANVDHVAYLAGPDVAPERAWWSNDPSAPDIVVGSRRSLWETLFPNYQRNARYMPTEFDVWQTGDTPAAVIDATTGKPMRLLGSYNLGALGFSHDGSKLILVGHVDRVPKLWESYEVPKGLDYWPYRGTPDGAAVSLNDRENDYAWPLQYQIIDLKGGTRRALIESPAADFQRAIVDQLQVAWSPDDRAVAVTGTYSPSGPMQSVQKGPVAQPSFESQTVTPTVCVDHANPKAGPVTGVSWDDAHNRLLVQSGTSEEFEYNGQNHMWRLASGRPHATPDAVTLTIQEDLNNPPVLTARDPRSGKSGTIFDPNPQLHDIALGNVSVYTWKSPRGLSATGGLAKPPDFVPGRRYPLVIQTHGFPQDQFFRVGLLLRDRQRRQSASGTRHAGVASSRAT